MHSVIALINKCAVQNHVIFSMPAQIQPCSACLVVTKLHSWH